MPKKSRFFRMIVMTAFVISGMGLLSPGLSAAKRTPPPEVPALIHQGVQYIVQHWGWENGRSQPGGYIEAFDYETGEKLWDLKVYDVTYDPALERDVQDVFITGIKIEGDNLVVTTERNEQFEVDLRTLAVKKR